MLKKKLVDLDDVIFDTSKLSSYQQQLAKKNHTTVLLQQLNGLPLGYFAFDKICNLSSDNLHIFIGNLEFIENLVLSDDRLLNFTMQEALEHIKTASISEIQEHDTFTELIQKELSYVINASGSNNLMLKVISDLLVSNSYLCFNATDSKRLILRDFKIVNNNIDFNIYLPTGLHEEKLVFSEIADSVDSQLLHLYQSLLAQFTVNDEFVNTIKHWITSSKAHVRHRVIMSNFYIPYVKYLIKTSPHIRFTKHTRSHSQSLSINCVRGWINEKVTSLHTFETKSNRLRYTKTDVLDPLWLAAQYIYDMNFTNIEV